jgi:photosystem II stability/assembly factor-like uncharacterized protein
MAVDPLIRRTPFLLILLAAVGAYAAGQATYTQVSPDLYAGLRWRNIGPFHGGRISAVTGVIGQAGTFYMGTPQGGVWKTTSAGVTWYPIFDQVTEVDGIGAIQVAPSDQNIIYVGTGDSVGGPDGTGMYKSTDGGRTWRHIGLEETTKINKLVVDPKDPDVVLASTTGDGATAGGVYRSTDGGRSWQNVLKPEGVNGTRDLESAFDTPNVIFAATQGIGGRGGRAGLGAGRGGTPPSEPAKLFKSTDEGRTWSQVTTLPPYPGRISVAIAMHTNGQRIYVVGAAIENGSGVYRSDDGGATWRHVGNGESRVSNGQGNYGSGVWVDSQNPDTVYVVSVPLYRSTDGGNTFSIFKGAPGGEDYHCMWIDPTNGQRMLVGTDQGATVTLDGGRTWSIWYNQPVAQVYHVSTDTRYPYWVMAAQQDTGAVMTRSRGDFGQINITDWLPLPSSEFGTITADPLHPEILYGVGYGAGQGGSGLVKINLATGQWENVAPNFGADSTKYRQARDFWKRFDTAFEPGAMYVGYQCLLVTRDGARTWSTFSPDLTTSKGEPMVPCGTAPPPAPAAAAGGRGAAPAAPAAGGRGGRGGAAIADFSLSTVRKGVVWTVSTNGQIYNTTDAGLHWTNVSNIVDAPASVSFNTIEAGHHDGGTAYMAGRAGRGGGAGGAGGAGAAEVDTNAPLLWRTHDGGKTWTKIVNGLPSDERTGSWVNVVREDPKQRGLLFAGTETTVYVSFDDGDHWQSLRQNLPSTSIRDMVFHTDGHMNDLVVGTYGRGFWVLDDMSPLRDIALKAQAIESAPAYLFKPGDAIRARINANWDQPINVEVPHASNPPYGAIIYYHLSRPPAGEMTLQVFDAAGRPVRTISSVPPPPTQGVLYPDYWLATPESRSLPTSAGTHRVNWDLHYDDPPALGHDLQNQMNMVPGMVTPGPHGPQALPGTYTLKLTVDGHVYTQTLGVRNDPRVGESAALMNALRAQHRLTLLAYQAMKDTYAGNEEVAAIRAQIAALTRGQVPPDVATQASEVDGKLAAFGGTTGGRGGRGGAGGRGGGPAAPGAVTSFASLNGTFGSLVSMMQVGLDMSPTRAQIDTWESGCKTYNATVAAWKALQTQDLAAFNSLLTKDNLKPLAVAPTKLAAQACTFAPPARPSGR